MEQDPEILHNWLYMGTFYLRNCLNEVFEQTGPRTLRMIGHYHPERDEIILLGHVPQGENRRKKRKLGHND